MSKYSMMNTRTMTTMIKIVNRRISSTLRSSSSLWSSSIRSSSSRTNSSSSSSSSSSSVSDEEVSKFSDLSKEWWDPRQNPLVAMNTIRMKYIVDQIVTTTTTSSTKTKTKRQQEEEQNSKVLPLSGLKALDVGCGGGILSESLARLGCSKVVGVDPSTVLVEQAKLHSRLDPKTRHVIEYFGGMTVEELAAASASSTASASVTTDDEGQDNDNRYDIICLLEVVEHVTDLDSILQACKLLLKPKTGRLFLSTINRTVKSHAVAIVGAEYIMNYLPIGTHNWNQFYSPDEIRDVMTNHQFSELNVQGMVITKPPPITIPFLENVTGGGEWSWKLDPNDKDVNWIGTYKN